MVKGKRLPEETFDRDKRLKIVSDLSDMRGQSKAALAHTLKRLNDQGLLVDPLSIGGSSSSYQRQIDRAVDARSIFENNMYGSIIQHRELPFTSKKYSNILVYVSPFAFLHQICRISRDLYNLIVDEMNKKGSLTILIYIDGINPCNPLHPEPEKLLEATYWTFAQLPSWLTRRKDGWFPFTLARSEGVLRLQGGMSEFVCIVLDIFYPQRGTSMLRGCTLVNEDDSKVITASFQGFLADEKAHKMTFDIKGQAGSVPCFNCINIRNRWVNLRVTETMVEQHHWDPDLSLRKPMTHKHVVALTKRLSDTHASGGNLKAMQTNCGINFNPTGLLFNARLMNIIGDVTEKYIRDPMHTLASKGVVGIELAQLIHALDDNGVPMNILQTYAKQFKLPRSRGYKPSDLYFSDKMLTTDHVKHFASDVLGMACILYTFLVDKIKPRGILVDNVKCFEATYRIINTVRRGTITEDIAIEFESTVVERARLFLALYGDKHAKIKFHHLFELARDMMRVGHFATCFPTERKNKDALSVCSATDKTIEKSSVTKFLNQTLSTWESNANLCQPNYLHNPSVFVLGNSKVRKSTSATLVCGEAFKDDVVALRSGGVGRVVEFLEHDSQMFVNVAVHRQIGDIYFEVDPSSFSIIDIDLIVELVCWYKSDTHNRLVVSMPLYCDRR